MIEIIGLSLLSNYNSMQIEFFYRWKFVGDIYSIMTPERHSFVQSIKVRLQRSEPYHANLDPFRTQAPNERSRSRLWFQSKNLFNFSKSRILSIRLFKLRVSTFSSWNTFKKHYPIEVSGRIQNPAFEIYSASETLGKIKNHTYNAYFI